MADEALYVHREIMGSPQLVGALRTGDEVAFSYDEGYLASPAPAPLSRSLPLGQGPFDPRSTASFFEGLVPEGSMRRMLSRALHHDADAYDRILSRLGDESVGAMLFSRTREVDWSSRDYEPLGEGWERSFAAAPRRFAVGAAVRSRLSLAGAQGKVGLYRDGQEWFLPMGCAPSTHIVKVSDAEFPGETVAEAVCLEAARRLDLGPEVFELIAVDGAEPLLALERFDRQVPESPELLGGHPVPWRLHQEDLCQASGLPPHMKYEPTDGHYASLVADVIERSCADAQYDRALAFDRLCFDYLAGNCDNHLKNRSLLYSPDWSRASLAPLYDVVPTTTYDGLSREMGVAPGPHRSIDDVTPADLAYAAREMELPPVIARGILEFHADGFEAAVAQAGESLASSGFELARDVAAKMRDDAAPRLDVVDHAARDLAAGREERR